MWLRIIEFKCSGIKKQDYVYIYCFSPVIQFGENVNVEEETEA